MFQKLRWSDTCKQVKSGTKHGRPNQSQRKETVALNDTHPRSVSPGPFLLARVFSRKLKVVRVFQTFLINSYVTPVLEVEWSLQCRKSNVSEMTTKLSWNSLEERHGVPRLSLLYKVVHQKVAFDTDQFHTKSEGGISTRKLSSISFRHPTSRKDCFKYSFLSRTMVQWNLLPNNIGEATTIESFKSRLNDMQLTTFLRGSHH